MDNIVKFDKPYKFEGKEYDSLDLSGMEKMTVQDLIDIQKSIGNETAAMYAMEMTTSFAQEMAVKATGKPVEFFKLMPRGKIKKVQAAVIKGMDNSSESVRSLILWDFNIPNISVVCSKNSKGVLRTSFVIRR